MTNRELVSFAPIDLDFMEREWPGSTVCMERDGVASWLDRTPGAMMWIRHPSDGTLTLMDFSPLYGTLPRRRWVEWRPLDERWTAVT